MGVPVPDQHAAAPLQVLQCCDEPGCIPEAQRTGLVVPALWIAVIGAYTESERDSVTTQVVRRRSELHGVGARVDVLQADERPVTFTRPRRERVEEEVRKREVTIGFARVHERHLADVGEVLRANGPRERRSVGAHGLGENACARAV